MHLLRAVKTSRPSLLCLLALGLAPALACDAADAGFDFDSEQAESRPESYCNSETQCELEVQPTKNSCVFYVGIDGSGLYSPDENSAIGRFYKKVPGPEALGANGKRAGTVTAETTRAYIEGVPGIVIDGPAERVERGLHAVCEHLDKRNAPCDIILMGYSRGSIIASHIAQALNDEGCAADGRHKGSEIAFLASFDPVLRSMGNQRRNQQGESVPWTAKIPSNVQRFHQVYKSQLTDPRDGLGGILRTTPHDFSSVPSACSSPLSKDQHPGKEDWEHGDIGHFELPQAMVHCSLEQSGIEVQHPVCTSCEDANGDGWGWENQRSCVMNVRCYECLSCEDEDGDGWGWENENSCRISADCLQT